MDEVTSSVMRRKSSKGRSRWRRALSRVKRKEAVEARYTPRQCLTGNNFVIKGRKKKKREKKKKSSFVGSEKRNK